MPRVSRPLGPKNKTMEKPHCILILFGVLILTTCKTMNGQANDDDVPTMATGYFGQKPPGLIPEVFAPGKVSTDEYVEGHIAFTPDMREFYFTRQGGKYTKRTLFMMRYENNGWEGPFELSTDIDTYRERFTPGLSNIKNLEPFKDLPIRGFSVSSNGTYYVYFLEADGNGHISYSRQINGTYENPVKMGDEINTGNYIAHPFVAPDESYLLWDAEKEGVSTPDIYISFRQQDGSWGNAISLGDEINTAAYEQGAKVTPDGKYLFFWRGDQKTNEDGSTYWVGNLYWMDAKFIENLRVSQ